MYSVILSRVSDSFVIKYARFISCQHVDSTKTLQDARNYVSSDISTNLQDTKVMKTGDLPLSLEIVLKKLVLCVINLNYAKLSAGDDVSFDKSLFDIPIEFVYGEMTLNNNFKFYLEYSDKTQPDDDDTVTVGFQIVE